MESHSKLEIILNSEEIKVFANFFQVIEDCFTHFERHERVNRELEKAADLIEDFLNYYTNY